MRPLAHAWFDAGEMSQITSASRLAVGGWFQAARGWSREARPPNPLPAAATGRFSPISPPCGFTGELHPRPLAGSPTRSARSAPFRVVVRPAPGSTYQDRGVGPVSQPTTPWAGRPTSLRRRHAEAHRTQVSKPRWPTRRMQTNDGTNRTGTHAPRYSQRLFDDAAMPCATNVAWGDA